jgi:hypothetical protein
MPARRWYCAPGYLRFPDSRLAHHTSSARSRRPAGPVGSATAATDWLRRNPGAPVRSLTSAFAISVLSDRMTPMADIWIALLASGRPVVSPGDRAPSDLAAGRSARRKYRGRRRAVRAGERGATDAAGDGGLEALGRAARSGVPLAALAQRRRESWVTQNAPPTLGAVRPAATVSRGGRGPRAS